jgi:hypothetical protein
MRLNSRALRFALVLTAVLFVTGLASVPWAANFPPLVQNALYALGRLPCIYVVFLIFMGVENGTKGR